MLQTTSTEFTWVPLLPFLCSFKPCHKIWVHAISDKPFLCFYALGLSSSAASAFPVMQAGHTFLWAVCSLSESLTCLFLFWSLVNIALLLMSGCCSAQVQAPLLLRTQCLLCLPHTENEALLVCTCCSCKSLRMLMLPLAFSKLSIPGIILFFTLFDKTVFCSCVFSFFFLNSYMGTVNDECVAEEGAENERSLCSHYLLDRPNKVVVLSDKKKKSNQECVGCVLIFNFFNASETLAISKQPEQVFVW